MNIANHLLRLAYALNPVAWFGTHGRIDSKEVGDDPNKPPVPNWLQSQVGEAVQWCIENKVPMRFILYKVRQVGCSTISICILYVLCRLYKMRCLVIGGEFSETDRVWNYLKTYGAKDTFDWGNTWSLNQRKATCTNGSEWERETAEDPNAGRAGGLHGLAVTELAKWPTDGTKSAAKVLTSLEGCIGEFPGTIEIIESTAAGPFGPFPDKWQGAVTLDQMKAGDRGNGFIKIFAPWYVFPQHTMKLLPGESETLMATIATNADDKAIEVYERHNLTLEQIKWYHFVAFEKCGKDSAARDQEFPTSAEDGFAATMPGRFSKKGLAYLEKMANAAVKGEPYVIGKRNGQDILSEAKELFFGRLVMDKGASMPRIMPCQPGFTKDFKRCIDPDCNIIYLSGLQKTGAKHIIATDNSMGRKNAVGNDIDKNAVILLRDGYIEAENGLWMPPEPIAILAPGNEWEQDLLAEFVAWLSIYMNKCMVAPEKNMGHWLISELEKRGIPMIETPRNPDEIDQSEGSGKYGWETNKKSKPMLTGELARRIREPLLANEGIACRFPNIVSELRTYVKFSDGTEGALKVTGCHDDFAMAFGIALMCRTAGTVYTAPIVSIPIPRDIALLLNQGKRTAAKEVW